MGENRWNMEELKDALIEYYESCIRTNHYDITECARHFCRENERMNVDYFVVFGILKDIENNK